MVGHLRCTERRAVLQVQRRVSGFVASKPGFEKVSEVTIHKSSLEGHMGVVFNKVCASCVLPQKGSD